MEKRATMDAFLASINYSLDEYLEDKGLRPVRDHGDEFLTVAEVCRLLKVTKQTIYVFISDGRLTRRKFGSRTRIRRSDVLALVREPAVWTADMERVPVTPDLAGVPTWQRNAWRKTGVLPKTEDCTASQARTPGRPSMGDLAK